MYQIGFFLLAMLAGVLPFAAPGPCTQALREGLVLCGGPLLLSLFPFLVVSSLLVQCPASDLLDRLLRGLCSGSQRGGSGRADRAAHRAGSGRPAARVCLLRAVLCSADGGREYAGQR